jgi:hypothetical protein
MFDALKRMFAGPAAGPDFSEVTAWAKGAGHGFKRARDNQGFVIEGRGWRLEAGPPQRAYIEGPELRLRSDLELPSDLQMVIMSRALMNSLERETFEQFTDSLKTYADDSTAPEEMRWLAMFRKLDNSALGALSGRFGAAALAPPSVQAWVGSALGAQLLEAAKHVPPEQPLVLMTNRGRVTLRTELDSLDGEVLGRWIALFETALQQLPVAVRALRAPAA